MPKGSEERTNARREEIVNACAALYETMSFKEITLKAIGRQTSFTRTSIYNYFQCKEEIFLALLQREYQAWERDLEAMRRGHDHMSAAQFASELARTLERRGRMLKLLSMDYYDMEANSRMEELAAFKVTYGAVMGAVARCLETFFPQMAQEDIQGFLYAFFPFLFGIYPYTVVSEKQRQAMEQAGTSYVVLSVYEITRSLVEKLLGDR